MADLTKFVTRAEGGKVFVAFNDNTFFELSPDAAKQIARAMQHQAAIADEYANAERIALDSALLLRVGAPLTLSNNPVIQDLAAKEAAWNSELRRYIPGGVKAESMVGTPTVIKEPA